MELTLLTESYDKLKNFEKIKLTKREIDIIACILHGRTSRKSIAVFLSTSEKEVSHRTIEYHTQNIIRKLDGASWEDIREAVENSKLRDSFRRHYEAIKFEQLLKKVLLKLQAKTDLTIGVYLCADSDKNAATKHELEKLVQYFYSYKINIDLKVVSADPNTHSFLDPKAQNQCVIYDETQYSLNSKKNKNIWYVDYGSCQNIYSFIVFLLKKLSVDSEEVVKLEVQLAKVVGVNIVEKNKPSQGEGGIPRVYAFWIVTLILSCVSLIIWLISIKNPNVEGASGIRAEMTTPSQSVLLDRPQIIRKVRDRLLSTRASGSSNPAVTLLGTGGAGKTILARSIAKKTNFSVVWEINAESSSSLFNSLMDLAQNLASTHQEKKSLSLVLETSDFEQRIRKTLQFLKSALRQKKEWLLIFDNVESVQQLADYLPLDRNIWGRGHILITTQNAYTKNVEFLEHKNVVEVTPLSTEEAISLFSKVCFKKDAKKLLPKERREIEEFLPQIPSFPLDISIAAKFISINKWTFQDYIKHIQQQNKTFYASQENILKETSKYIKSRYSVITLTLDNVIKLAPDSERLLWTISLLNSQHIPVDLLIKGSNSNTTNLLLHAMRKFSLISSEHENNGRYSFSIHRSAQAIMRSYLVDRLRLTPQHDFVSSSSMLFGKYLKEILDTEDVSAIVYILPHCEHWILSDLKTQESNGILLSNLGSLEYHLGNNRKARLDLENSLNLLKKPSIFSAQARAYLGSLYAKSAEVKKARTYLEDALKVFRQYTEDIGYPRALSFMGYVHMVQDEFRDAMKYFDSALGYFQNKKPHPIFGKTLIYEGLLAKEHLHFNKAISCFNQAIEFFEGKNDLINTGWVKGYLGITYREMGLYEKSRSILEQSVSCYHNANASKHNALGVVLLGLGNCYRNLGLYHKAQNCFNECEEIYVANGSEINIAWCNAHQGRLELKKNKIEAAQPLLLKSLKVFERVYGASNIRTAWLYLQVGLLFRDQQQFKVAEKYFKKSLKIYEDKLPDNYIRISKVKVEMGILAHLKGNSQSAKKILEENIPLYESYYGESHIQTAGVLRVLGQVYKDTGEKQKGERLIKRAKVLASTRKHAYSKSMR